MKSLLTVIIFLAAVFGVLAFIQWSEWSDGRSHIAVPIVFSAIAALLITAHIAVLRMEKRRSTNRP